MLKPDGGELFLEGHCVILHEDPVQLPDTGSNHTGKLSGGQRSVKIPEIIVDQLAAGIYEILTGDGIIRLLIIIEAPHRIENDLGG